MLLWAVEGEEMSVLHLPRKSLSWNTLTCACGCVSGVGACSLGQFKLQNPFEKPDTLVREGQETGEAHPEFTHRLANLE